MAIFRGVGGSGDSSDNSFLQEVTAQAQAAEASATSAANSLAAIQETEVTSASFNTGDGVLTLTKTGGATVTADLDGRFLTSYTETNDLSTAVTWANVPDANITESSVTQHLTAANVTSPLSGGTGISIASNGTITNDSPDQTVALTGTGATTVTGTYPNFTIDSTNTTYTVGDGGLTTNDFTDADHTKLNGIEANATADQTGAEIKTAYEAEADTNAFTDAEKTKLSNIEANADVTDTANVTSAGAAMLASSPTFTGTITAPNVDISTTGSVTTNIATGVNASNNTDVKVVNIGTGYGSGFFAGDSTTINIGSQSSSAKNIFNIGSGVSVAGQEDTINLKGNVTVDGTLAGLSYNYSTQLFQGYTNLTTSPTQIGPDFYLRNYNSKHYKRFIEVNASMGYSGTSSTNDLNLRVILVVPSGSGNAVDIGSVVSVTSTGIYNRDIVISGDVTHWFSDYAGVGANSNGATPFTSVVSAVYNPTTDQTTFNAGVYNATVPSVGDSVYVHPFDWESSGTEIYSTVKQFDVDAEASMNYEIYNKVYYGNIDRIATCRLKFYEAASSDVINIQRLRIHQVDESV